MAHQSVKWTAARTTSLALTIIPVFFFLLVVGNLIWTSLPAVKLVGLPVLFSTKFSSRFSGIYTPGEYGLLPAIWGTFMVAGVALMIAFPISLAMSIFATEFTLGGVGYTIEGLLAIFAGIPEIIYALLSIFVINIFIQPMFAGQGLPEDVIMSLPGLPAWNAAMLPNMHSTLLGGILLSLLIIPFMAPLMVDAIRNVPIGLKEASLALGATRWFTLWRVTLPSALTGIIAAVSLGILKTIGDVVISAWTIGYIKSGMPVPLWDALEAVAPLTSTGAGLLNGLHPGGNNIFGPDTAVAYFAALLILIMTFLILISVSLLQNYFKRRFTQ